MFHQGLTATIDLAAIAANYQALCQLAAPAEIAAVVKADAYGLGAATLAPFLYRQGCRSFYVAHYKEALALRPLLPATIMLAPLHGIPDGAERESRHHGITPVINDPAALERMARRAPGALLVHVDTGMNRLGFSLAQYQNLAANPQAWAGCTIHTVISHLACADIPDHPHNSLQLQRFITAAAATPQAKKSFASSHGAFLGAAYHGDQLRIGRALSGTLLSPQLANPLRMALRLTAPIVQCRTVEADGWVGYGAGQRVKKGTRLATLAVGYGDGIPRDLSNDDQQQQHIFYHGNTALPLVGRVSMDLTVVDVSHVAEALLNATPEVTLVGDPQSLDALAASAGTLGYEVMTQLLPRVVRRYV